MAAEGLTHVFCNTYWEQYIAFDVLTSQSTCFIIFNTVT